MFILGCAGAHSGGHSAAPCSLWGGKGQQQSQFRPQLTPRAGAELEGSLAHAQLTLLPWDNQAARPSPPSYWSQPALQRPVLTPISAEEIFSFRCSSFPKTILRNTEPWVLFLKATTQVQFPFLLRKFHRGMAHGNRQATKILEVQVTSSPMVPAPAVRGELLPHQQLYLSPACPHQEQSSPHWLRRVPHPFPSWPSCHSLSLSLLDLSAPITGDRPLGSEYLCPLKIRRERWP